MNRTHVVIRNTKVNAVRLIEVSDRGSFTETKMGSPFRKLNAEGRPIGIEIEERLSKYCLTKHKQSTLPDIVLAL
jgi:hypothetical protein